LINSFIINLITLSYIFQKLNVNYLFEKIHTDVTVHMFKNM